MKSWPISVKRTGVEVLVHLDLGLLSTSGPFVFRYGGAISDDIAELIKLRAEDVIEQFAQDQYSSGYDAGRAEAKKLRLMDPGGPGV